MPDSPPHQGGFKQQRFWRCSPAGQARRCSQRKVERSVSSVVWHTVPLFVFLCQPEACAKHGPITLCASPPRRQCGFTCCPNARTKMQYYSSYGKTEASRQLMQQQPHPDCELHLRHKTAAATSCCTVRHDQTHVETFLQTQAFLCAPPSHIRRSKHRLRS